MSGDVEAGPHLAWIGQVADHDDGPLGGQAVHYRPTDPACTTGHHHYPTVHPYRCVLSAHAAVYPPSMLRFAPFM